MVKFARYDFKDINLLIILLIYKIVCLDDEEEFFPLHGIKNKTFVPSMDSSMTSSISSVASR